jgi:two-component system nitrogen regulation response regulator GlnG
VEALEARAWRGNVRELRNAVFRLVLLARNDMIDRQAVEAILGPNTEPAANERSSGLAEALAAWLRQVRPAEGELSMQ